MLMKKDMWQKVAILGEQYSLSKEEKFIDEIFRVMDTYLISIACRSQEKSKYIGNYIGFEDFYSNLMVAIWEGIEFYATQEGHQYTLKNILIKRIRFSEIKTWKSNQMNLCGTDYLEKIENKMSSKNHMALREFYDLIFRFRKKYVVEGTIIYLLAIGYSPANAIKCLRLSAQYDDKHRKKIQRIRAKFKKFLEDERV